MLNQAGYILFGFFIAIALGSIAYALIKVIGGFISLTKAITESGKSARIIAETNSEMVKTLGGLAQVGQQVALEVNLLRSMLTPTQEAQAPQNAAQAVILGVPRPTAGPFPPMDWSMYTQPSAPAPDANVEDTEIYDIPDSVFVDNEKLEEIRGAGFEAESDEPHPGVVAAV